MVLSSRACLSFLEGMVIQPARVLVVAKFLNVQSYDLTPVDSFSSSFRCCKTYLETDS